MHAPACPIQCESINDDLEVVLIPVYYVVLDAWRKLCEIGTEAAYANNEVFILFRISFGISQFIGINHVILNMRTVIQHESICIGNKFINALFTLQNG